MSTFLGVIVKELHITIYGTNYKTRGGNGRWIKLHKEELHNLHSSPSMDRIIKSRIWAGHVA
jgi:hypothetical protein